MRTITEKFAGRLQAGSPSETVAGFGEKVGRTQATYRRSRGRNGDIHRAHDSAHAPGEGQPERYYDPVQRRITLKAGSFENRFFGFADAVCYSGRDQARAEAARA